MWDYGLCWQFEILYDDNALSNFTLPGIAGKPNVNY